MTLHISGNLMIVLLLLPVGLVVVLAAWPRWYIRSMSKHSLWRLRDDVVDDVIFGRLPAEHPAVEELIARSEWAIAEARSFDLLHLLVWSWSARDMTLDTRRKLKTIPPLDGLDGPQAERVAAHRRQYNAVSIRAVFLSSWFGIAFVTLFGIRVLLHALTNHVRDGGFRFAVGAATDRVAESTPLGRSAREFVTVKGSPEDLCHAAA